MPDPIHGVNPTQPPDVASTGQTPTAPASGAVDSADVARAEVLLVTISTAAGSVPAIDQAQIAELQRAILSGTYQVNPQQIAQKIIEIEQLLAIAGG